MKMRVGLLNDTFPPTIDGVAITTKNYADCLERLGCDPTVIAPKYPKVADNYKYEVYRYASVPLEKFIGYRAGAPFSPLVISQLRSRKFHLLHTHCPFASSVMARNITLSESERVPVVLTYHTKFDIDLAKRVKMKKFLPFATKFVRYNISMADEVWVVSEGTVQSLRLMGYEGDYQVMRNGTDFTRGKASPERIAAAEQKYGIRPGVPLLYFIGRMMWYKNTRLILDGLNMLKERGIPFQAMFIGDGTDAPEVKAYSSGLRLDDQVTFTGAIHDREELRAIASRAELLLFPSSYDTSGLVVIEAAACDCPAILVRGSCAAEGVTDNETGFLCEETAQDFAETLQMALSDPAHLKKVAEQAGKAIYLSWEQSVARAYARYEEILYAWKYKDPERAYYK